VRAPALAITAARGSSWLEVRATDGNGEQLHYGLLEQGRTLTFARLPVWVRAGALHNLDLRLDGERVAHLPGAAAGVAELVASPAGVAAPSR
jgi:hypothetical protein